MHLSNGNIKSNLEAITVTTGVSCWRRADVQVIRGRLVEATIVDIGVTDGRTRGGTKGQNI